MPGGKRPQGNEAGLNALKCALNEIQQQLLYALSLQKKNLIIVSNAMNFEKTLISSQTLIVLQ